MKIAAIVNPASRAGLQRGLLPLVERSFGSQLVGVRYARGSDEATALTRQLVRAGADTVVAVGGDGTVNAIVNGLIGSRCNLGIIPAGTANDLASGMGLPRHIDDACKVIRHGVVCRIDVIGVNAWHFITSGGVGLPVDVLETVEDLRAVSGLGLRCARLLGSSLYPISMLYQLFRGAGPARNVELQLDGRRMHLCVHALLVTKLQRIGKHMRIAPDAGAADGKLHVFALEASGSRLDVALSALSTLTGRAGRKEGVRLFSGRQLTLRMEGATPFCADGETRLCSSVFQFNVIPGGIGLLCPR